MATKTPVTILQELLVRDGCPPQYELIYDGTGTAECIFEYEVTARGTTARGRGRSKKEAKHEAARVVLQMLCSEGAVEALPVAKENIDSIQSPYKNQLQENAVGSLLELCGEQQLQLPEYELIGDEGPPHAKQFTFICSVSKLSEIGIGRTKKQAKQLAAYKMLARLRNSLGPDVISKAKEKTSPDVEPIIEMYSELKGGNVKKQKTGQKLWDIPTLYDLESDNLQKLKSYVYSSFDNPVELLESIASDFETELMVQSVAGVTNHITLIGIQFSTLFAQQGHGPTPEESKRAAAIELLNVLKLMCTPPESVCETDETNKK